MTDLSARIADIAHRILGEPNREYSTRRELRFGSRGSISVEIAGSKQGEWYDHENCIGGGPREFILLKGGVRDDEIDNWLEREIGIKAERKPNGHDYRRIAATYKYQDEQSELLFEVVRFAPKDFRQRRPDGKGDWMWSTKDVRQVPYRLPELIEAVGGRIFVAEGEKDVDRLVVWGLFATCNPGGSGKWRADFAQYFASADVVVIADNDNPGRDHARAVATNVAATAAKVRILELPGLPEKGDFCDWVAAGGTPDQLEELVAEAPLFRSPAPPVGDEITRETIEPHAIANIPPRPWAYGTLLLFGHASVIGAVDGGGKGALAVAIALSIITGQALLNEHVWRTGPVAIITYEDDKTEWDRRIAAACIHYGLDYASVKNQFHFLIRKDRLRIRFAVQSPVGTTYPDSVGIIRHMKEIGTVLLIIDPFNHAHDMEDGNSNTAIAKVAGEVSRIAAESEAAVLVLHHLRKGATGNVDDLMGATALRANFRSCRILTKMTPTEGAKLKLPVNQQWWLHSRIAGAKDNYAPPPEFTTWYRLVSVDIGNPAGIYVNGDNMQVTTLWSPPSEFEGISLVAVQQIFDLIRREPPDMPGEFWAPARQTKAQWVGNPIARVIGGDLDVAASVVATWIKNQVLVEHSYHSPSRRKPITGVTLNETKAAEILGPLYTLPDADDSP